MGKSPNESVSFPITAVVLISSLAAATLTYFFIRWSNGSSIDEGPGLYFLEELMGVIALGVTLALFVAALNVFAIQERVNRIMFEARAEVEELRRERDRATKLFEHIPSTLHLLTSALGGADEDPSELKRLQTEIMWERKFFTVLSSSSDQQRLNECRDIIGSMEFEDRISSKILKQTTDVLSEMLAQDGFDDLSSNEVIYRKTNIRRLLRLGWDILDKHTIATDASAD